MSFILESIKQAERERKLGQAPTITVEYATPMEGFNAKKDWMKWVVMGFGLLFAIFAALIGIKMTSNNFFASNSEVVNPISEQQVIVDEENDVLDSVAVNKQDSIDSSIAESAINEDEVHFASDKDLRNSELKEVQIIDHQTQKSQMQLVDNRTKVIQQDEIQPAEVDYSEKVSQQNKAQPVQINKVKTNEEVVVAEAAFNKIEALQSSQEQIGDAANRSELYSLYSDLSKANTDDVLPQDLPANIQYIDEEIIRSEQPKLLASVEPNVPTPSEQAVDSGISEFGELPYDIQENVPDINISVHMFNQDSSNRRIRINGRMYTEGTNLQQDLALVEITPYGAIFDYQGHLFRLNVR